MTRIASRSARSPPSSSLALEDHIERDHGWRVLAQALQHAGVLTPREDRLGGVESLQRPVVDGDHDDTWVGGARAPHREPRVDRAQLEPLDRLRIPQVEREPDREGGQRDHGRGQAAVAHLEAARALASLRQAPLGLGRRRSSAWRRRQSSIAGASTSW